MELFDLNIHFPVTDPTWIFFLVLIIILFAPMILGRLRIPHIIGMILAGVVVGKYGFNILERDSSFELFGKVGLYYIMFLAGLEMDMDDFKKNRTKGLVFGMFTFLIPMGLGIWSSMSMLNYGFLTSVLLASMYASHTLIAYPIISRYGLSRQRTVSITIGGTAVTVVLALMVLAVIGGMYKGEDVGGLFWVLLVAKVVLLFGLIIFLMPRISRWFFRTYEDAVMQFIFLLALIIGAVHICIAMKVKAEGQTGRFGFKESLSAWGWLLLVVGFICTGGLSFFKIISEDVSTWAFIVIGGVSAIGIYLLNNIHRNVFVNIGAGVWDTYNMATGLMGDILSYIRLYALGLAGGMLGGVFNQLAFMVNDAAGPALGWLFCGLILIFGHTLNIAMSCLSAFVHPLRLTFVEYFKNSGYEGKGEAYKPFTVVKK